MTETDAQYQTETKEFTTAMTFTLYLKQIGELSDLQQQTGKKRSPIMQDAVDTFHSIQTNQTLKRLRELTGLDNLELITRGVALLAQKIEKVKE
jgi:hypothetical protein